MKIWRLIPLIEASGKTQMAIDTWLLNQHQQGNCPPTLRFYTWNPPAISLGYHQHHWPEAWQSLTWNAQALDLVRRPTGGRAVLHQGDLTYAVITSGIPGNRMQVYQTLCEFLIQAWRSLGITLHYGKAGRGYIQNPNCFGTATGADLVTETGAKLIGSAQLYRGHAVLQHGSMQLGLDANLFQQVFGVVPTVVQLPAPLQGTVGIELIIQALMAMAQRCFEAELQVLPLSETEWQMIREQPDLDLELKKP